LFGKSGKAIKGRDIAIFSRQLATMMAAGVPMVQGFEIVAGGQSNPRMKDMLTNIKQDIEGGSSLNEALGKYPVQFDELFTNLVKAGESAGVLDTVLDTIATYKENIENIKGKIKKAMFYPAAVLAVAVIVSCILLIFVIPQFEDVFKGARGFAGLYTDADRHISLDGFVLVGSSSNFRWKRVWPHNHLQAIGEIPAFGGPHDVEDPGRRRNPAPIGNFAFCTHTRRDL
jgi:hypothetical protein